MALIVPWLALRIGEYRRRDKDPVTLAALTHVSPDLDTA